MDDTLYLERDYVRSGFAAVSQWATAALGIPDFFDRAWRAFEEGARGNVFDRCLNESGIQSPTMVAQMVSVYRSHRPDIALATDARGFLERVKGRRLALITDGPLASQRAKAQALELSNWIDPIVFTAEHGPDFCKPSARAFEFVAARFAARATDCWYVADNPRKDFQAPRALGWHTVRVRRPGGLHFDVPGSDDIDVEIGSFDSFPGIV